jgi:tetratricopeptide (TPR) repeat protein
MQRNHLIIITIALVFISASATGALASAPVSRCEESDKVCKEFEGLTEAEKPEAIIAKYEAARTEKYSDESLRLVGGAYLAMASRDNLTPEQEEGYYRKALGVGHSIAYMGLYFFHVQKDEEKALGFLQEYVKTKPADTVPYVLLGEAELERKNYALADGYLREAKKVARAHSPRVDWLLFQANYLLKNYQFAREMFESAVTKGNFEGEAKALSADPRFEGIGKRPEFKSYQELFKAPQKTS